MSSAGAWWAVGLGFALLVVGAELLVRGASRLAAALGVRPLVIGLTIVAFGTSAPELATSVGAALHGSSDLALGNVVGSNIFNILCVLGLSSLVAPAGIAVSSTALKLDIPVMITVAAACLPIFLTGHLISRWEGGLFFFYYLAYTTYMVLNATSNELSHTLRDVMLAFVLPLTAITLGVTVWRNFRHDASTAKA